MNKNDNNRETRKNLTTVKAEDKNMKTSMEKPAKEKKQNLPRRKCLAMETWELVQPQYMYF